MQAKWSSLRPIRVPYVKVLLGRRLRPHNSRIRRIFTLSYILRPLRARSTPSWEPGCRLAWSPTPAAVDAGASTRALHPRGVPLLAVVYRAGGWASLPDQSAG